MAHLRLPLGVFLSVLLIASQVSALVPWPQVYNSGSDQPYSLSPALAFTSLSRSAILQAALTRYHQQIFSFPTAATKSAPGSVVVNVNSDNENLQFGVDESYVLQINQQQVTVNASTIWGAMHGLESFSQLVSYDPVGQAYSLVNGPIYITDAPRFPWRGLLIDSARHYLLPSAIMRTIDALAASKLNTLHWHLIDAQSFPIVSTTNPNLSAKGAFFPTAIYTPQVVQSIITYGKQRGVRVLPEFDVPGHAAAWGKSDPTLTVTCPKYQANINNIPLNPTLDHTYKVLQAFVNEMAGVFPDNHMHFGGDELVYGCWNNNPQVVQYMNAHHLTTQDLFANFEKQLSQMVTAANKTMVLWQDVFDYGVSSSVPKNAVIQVWESGNNVMQGVIDAGFHTILSAGWYLNQQTPNPNLHHGEYFDTWIDFYQNDPYNGLNLNPQKQKLILGGEAAMWGEQADSFTMDPQIWPRTAAAAERLWSPQSVTNVATMTIRLNNFSCYLQQLGVRSTPLAPGYCFTQALTEDF